MAKTKPRNGHGATTVLKGATVMRPKRILQKANNGYQHRSSRYKGPEQATSYRMDRYTGPSPLPEVRRSARPENVNVSEPKRSTKPDTATKSKTPSSSPKTPKSGALASNYAVSEAEDDDEEQTPLQRTLRSSNAAKPKYGMEQDGTETKITPGPAKKSKVDPKSKDGDGKKYEVEKILEVKIKENGQRQFLLKWKRYPVNQATWEPENGLACDKLLKAFMSKVLNHRVGGPMEAKTVEQPKERKPYWDRIRKTEFPSSPRNNRRSGRQGQ